MSVTRSSLLATATSSSVIVIGEVAGALHGWPLVLGAEAIEVCARPADIDGVGVSLGAREVVDGYALAGGVRLIVDEMPAGTFGFGDLARAAEAMKVGGSEVRVAGVLDLLRIAEASAAPEARREALAYQAVLDVARAQAAAEAEEAVSTPERERRGESAFVVAQQERARMATHLEAAVFQPAELERAGQR